MRMRTDSVRLCAVYSAEARLLLGTEDCMSTLGHTKKIKIVPEMTYNVLSATLIICLFSTKVEVKKMQKQTDMYNE